MANLLDTSDSFSFSDHNGRPCVVSFHDNVKDQEIAEYALTDALPSYLRDNIKMTRRNEKKQYKQKATRLHYRNKINSKAKENKSYDDMLLKEIRGY